MSLIIERDLPDLNCAIAEVTADTRKMSSAMVDSVERHFPSVDAARTTRTRGFKFETLRSGNIQFNPSTGFLTYGV
jgi:hypothetical protein